ncbi:MAG: hypothetical protein KDA91_18140, partial [Planctomycetaceae bacterium]|nr:hypothetical protein [Planctomycetaceae bacterium]
MLSQTRTSPRNLSIVICLLLLAAAGEQVHAQNKRIRIAETLWGFDGRVVPGQFNPVSVLLDNLTDDAVEGVVTLQGVSGMLQDVGGRLAEPLYLSPHTMRWVQFYPYVSREATTWRLAIRTDKGVIFANELTQGRSVFSDALDGTDAKTASAVILDPSGLTNRIPTSVKHMPAEIFPPYSTALVGLQVLFLDHVPDWETPRQDALLSWVRSGGELHLLRDSNRQSLVFPSAMADLNQPFDDFLLGSGRVVRHDIQRSELSQAIVYPITLQMGFSEDPDRVEIKQQNEIKVRSSVSAPSVIDEELFAGMRLLTQPEHAWWLIFLMSLCYIGLIF